MINKIKENWIVIVSVVFCLLLISGIVACFSHRTREIITVKDLTWKSYVYVKELTPHYYTNQTTCPTNAYDVYRYKVYNTVSEKLETHYDYYKNEWDTIKTLSCKGKRGEKIKYKKVKLKENQDKSKSVSYYITYKKESDGKVSTEKIDEDMWNTFPEPGEQTEVEFSLFGISDIME